MLTGMISLLRIHILLFSSILHLGTCCRLSPEHRELSAAAAPATATATATAAAAAAAATTTTTTTTMMCAVFISLIFAQMLTLMCARLKT